MRKDGRKWPVKGTWAAFAGIGAVIVLCLAYAACTMMGVITWD